MGQILPNLAAELEAAKAMIAKQQELIAALNRPKAISLKVSEKGAISVYGLGRLPVTLYRGQMERLLDQAPIIKAFIATNATLLATKD